MPLPQIIPVGQTPPPFGSTYKEHVKKFWKTFLEIPRTDNPFQNPGKCEGYQNRPDPVFYVPPNLGGESTRTCRTSEGKGILIPVIVVVVLPHELGPGQSQPNVAKGDQDSVTTAQLEISIPGDRIVLNKPQLDAFRISTGTFDANMPVDALFRAPPGLTPCEADGRYVIAGPISAGTYNLKFSGSLNCPGPNCLVNERNFRTVNNVTLIVE